MHHCPRYCHAMHITRAVLSSCSSTQQGPRLLLTSTNTDSRMAVPSVPLSLYYITLLQCHTCTVGSVKSHQAALLASGPRAACQQNRLCNQHCPKSHPYMTLKPPTSLICFLSLLMTFVSDRMWMWWRVPFKRTATEMPCQYKINTSKMRNQQKPTPYTNNCSSSFWRCEECLHILLPGGPVILRPIKWGPNRLTNK